MSSPSSPEGPALPRASTLAIHLDLVGGISGDMFVAAMVDALPALAAPVLAALAAARPDGARAPAFHESSSGGLRARRFGFAIDPDHGESHAAPTGGRCETLRSPDAHLPENEHAHAHGHAGTAYVELRSRLAAAPLPEATRRHALALLALLADAEARVHGIAVDRVHFHELADWDSLMDVVAAGSIAAKLDGAKWTASSLPVGGGTVRAAHGVLPVPAPATSLLLEGYPWHDDGVGGERVTPTGAAILRHLVPAARCGSRREPGRLIVSGSGAGTRTLPGIPNIVRALVFERAAATDTDADTVTVIEFDVDDMTGEEIAVAADRLRVEAGVLDLSIGTRQGKKGRPVADFRLLARPEAMEAIATACFAETSTLGLRVRDERRRTLRRSEVAATIDGTPVGVKVALRPGGERTAKAAQDDVRSARGLAERRRVRGAASALALKDSKR